MRTVKSMKITIPASTELARDYLAMANSYLLSLGLDAEPEPARDSEVWAALQRANDRLRKEISRRLQQSAFEGL